MGEHITNDGTVYDYATGQRIGMVHEGTIVLDEDRDEPSPEPISDVAGRVAEISREPGHR